MTYSEFGRRVEDNGSGGTDHGAAAPLFVLGSRVKGGFYGAPPSLTDLDRDGNLKFSTDFRQVYASVLANWIDADPGRGALRQRHFRRSHSCDVMPTRAATSALLLVCSAGLRLRCRHPRGAQPRIRSGGVRRIDALPGRTVGFSSSATWKSHAEPPASDTPWL